MSDDDIVYVATGCDRFHKSRECQGLSHARTVEERSLSSLSDEFSLCELCSGTYRLSPSDGSFVTARVLENLDPEDVG
ncbi:hypothetical protein [Natrinema halophilum]|uniref:Uncharacterized protein n=1 Tax=Natrinema halophilum TaxID=1699371 RepID=A0A7D5KD78_9EURY|nr:hypothetical protein [Natrinema halophilum]QLG49201.1 hypothetical protein HYG82_10195 [Natrinema halophilum]